MLDQEAQRQAHQAAPPPAPATVPGTVASTVAGVLPGVGVDPVSLRDAVRQEGRATLGTAGAIWCFALFEFAVLAVLAPDLQRQFDLGDRFLVNVVMAPALLFFVAQPVGNLVDRATTNRPRVMGTMVGIAAVALAVAGLTANRWVFFVACAVAGLGLLASQPAQIALLADRYPLAARAETFSAYTAIGLVAVRRRPAARRPRRRRGDAPDRRVAHRLPGGRRAGGRPRVPEHSRRRRPPGPQRGPRRFRRRS